MKRNKKYIIIFIVVILILIVFNPKVKATTELTEFEKAFKEVAYAYYMRGPSLQYNVAKGTVKSPEESTSQDNNYLACAFYVMNVYKELLGIDLCHNDKAYCNYARDFVGERQEVVGYGHLEDSGDLYWYDGTKDTAGALKIIENPTQDYIISQLKIGDIIDYAGHVMLVYDYVYDNDGNIIDVYLLNSTITGNYYTRTKTDCTSLSSYYYDKSEKRVSLPITYAQWSKLFYINHDMTGFCDESISNEGTVQLETLKYRATNMNQSLLFDKSNPNNKYAKDYGILRFVTTDEHGNDLLNFDGTYSFFNGEKSTNKTIEYADSVKSRIDYSKLYIEKTVDKRDNNAVLIDDELNYKIVVKNNSKENYSKDLVVKEDLSEYIDYISYSCSKTGVSFQANNGQLVWNLGKINSGEEVVITYKVVVKPGYAGKTIESTGTVANIPSGLVKNRIEAGMEIKQDVFQTFESLKSTYSGRKLINEIYKQAYGVNIGLEDFNMLASDKNSEDGLIYSNKKWGAWNNYNNDVYLATSKNNKFANMVLNGYFNTLWKSTANRVSINNVNINWSALIGWQQEKNNPDNRSNTIYPEDFKTGDILIYNNTNDKSYYYSSGNETDIKEWTVTRENGEYCYIYIEGKGFIGINTGSDESSTNDDRNEFNSKYFDSPKITMYVKNSKATWEMTDEIKEWMSYQSLFGKDSYVILRPSLDMNLIPISLDVNYNITEKTNQDIIVTVSSNKKMLPIEGWTLSEDKLTLTKTYMQNTEEELTVYDYGGNERTVEIKIENIDKEKPEYEVKYSTTLSTNADVTVTITANEEIQSIEGWTLSEDKKVLTKTYTENKSENIKLTDLAGNTSTAVIDIKNIDKEKPVVEVKYSTTEKTLNDVIVTIEANEVLQEIEGWQLSDDKKMLTKTYTKNGEETITIYDLAGNSIVETIKVENIDKEKPEYEITYSTTLSTNEDVTVTITANEEIQSVEGWTLSEDKKVLTKTYTENTEEEVIIKDLVGNSASKTIIKINNIDKIKPEINISYSITELTNQDIIVTITANEEIKEIEGWNLSTDKKELKKKFTSNTEKSITISDLAGNTISDTIKISNIDKVTPKTEVKYSTTSATDKDVIVTITSDKIIRNVDGWTLSNDKKQLTKTFKENGEEQITITDEAGNSVTTNIKVSNIDKTEAKQVDMIVTSNNDTTTAKMILPNTGEKNVFIFIAIFMIISTIMYIKLKKYKDVK